MRKSTGRKDINGTDIKDGDRLKLVPDEYGYWPDTEYIEGMEVIARVTRSIDFYDPCTGKWLRHWNDGSYESGADQFPVEDHAIIINQGEV